MHGFLYTIRFSIISIYAHYCELHNKCNHQPIWQLSPSTPWKERIWYNFQQENFADFVGCDQVVLHDHHFVPPENINQIATFSYRSTRKIESTLLCKQRSERNHQFEEEDDQTHKSNWEYPEESPRKHQFA